ncbi:MAG: hypothetical protein JXP73_15415 [Deltaproteobacteria bacterium]|nr:hypothetical protein [Deltaproteobacteria bacterium]
MEPIFKKRGQTIQASAAASAPKLSIFQAEPEMPDRAERGRHAAELRDRSHLTTVHTTELGQGVLGGAPELQDGQPMGHHGSRPVLQRGAV